MARMGSGGYSKGEASGTGTKTKNGPLGLGFRGLLHLLTGHMGLHRI